MQMQYQASVSRCGWEGGLVGGKGGEELLYRDTKDVCFIFYFIRREVDTMQCKEIKNYSKTEELSVIN